MQYKGRRIYQCQDTPNVLVSHDVVPLGQNVARGCGRPRDFRGQREIFRIVGLARSEECLKLGRSEGTGHNVEDCIQARWSETDRIVLILHPPGGRIEEDQRIDALWM